MHARDRLTVLCSYRYKSMYSTSTATDRAWVEGECCQNVQKYQYVLLVHLHRSYKKKEEKKKRTCQVPIQVHFLIQNCLAQIPNTTKKIGRKKKGKKSSGLILKEKK